MRCLVKHENKNSISTSNHVLFCLSYKHTSPLLGRKANFVDEWKQMNQQSTNNNHRVHWHLLLRWKNALNHNYKNNNAHNFQFTNSHLLTLSLSTEEVFQINGQNWPVANLLVVNFHSQTREMLTPKPLTFGFSLYYYIGFLPLLRKFEPHSLSGTQIF